MIRSYSEDSISKVNKKSYSIKIIKSNKSFQSSRYHLQLILFVQSSLFQFPVISPFYFINEVYQHYAQNIFKMNPLSKNYLNHVGSTSKTKPLPQHRSVEVTKTSKPSVKQPTVGPILAKQYQDNALIAKFQLGDPETYSHLQFCKEGYMFAYTSVLGKIAGRATIIFPQGIIANCNVFNQEIHGWAVLFKRNVFVNISSFRRGRFEGPQYTHNIEKGIMVEALYKSGRMHSMVRCQTQGQKSFDKFIRNKSLSDLLRQTQENVFFDKYYPRVQSSLGNYYGQKIGDIPSGLGVLMAIPQIFYGQFYRGLLEGNGTMVFGNGTSFTGQFYQGCPNGFECFLKNDEIVCKYNDRVITAEELKRNLDVGSFGSDQSIKRIFGPIVQFYQKLRAIYEQSECQASEKELSFVDIQLAKDDQHQFQGQSSHNKSRDSSSQMFTDRMNSLPTTPFNHDQNFKQTQKPSQSSNLSKKQQSIRSEEVITVKKGFTTNNKKRQANKKKMLATDQEWDEMIEELDAEESVGLEGGFLMPKSQPLTDQPREEVYLKGTSLRTSEGRQNVVKLGKEAMYGNEKQQIKLGRIIGQLSKAK